MKMKMKIEDERSGMVWCAVLKGKDWSIGR